MKPTPFFAATFGALATFLTAALAQVAAPGGYDVAWSTIDDGGGVASGGGYAVQGTIGQPDAPAAAPSGGGYSLIGGFWPGAAGPPPDPCPADITPGAGDGIVDIDDLFAVINSWGACPGCPADIAPQGGDGAVDVDDLFAVINAWGACP